MGEYLVSGEEAIAFIDAEVQKRIAEIQDENTIRVERFRDETAKYEIVYQNHLDSARPETA